MSPVQKTTVAPFIPAESNLREFTPRAIVVGTLLGMIFGASSVFLTLKVGLTVSASIPVAVISMTLFRLWAKIGGGFGARDATILEHNIAQTAGSAGESLAFGIGVTMPAILILGFDLEWSRTLLVAVLGGLLGILLMIPLRRALIVQQHGVLKYPEGTACAAVLKAGANAESLAAAHATFGSNSTAAGVSAGAVFAGFGIGLVYNTLCRALKLWKDTVAHVFGAPLATGSLAAEISPEMLGVGYIIGPKIGGVMAAGGVLSYLVLVPMIKFFGTGLAEPLSPGTKLIRDMGVKEIRDSYILYIGAGAVAAGGLVSLARSLPTIWRAIRGGLADLTETRAGPASTLRTERDLSLKFVGIGILGLLVAILSATPLQMTLPGAFLILLFGGLFVTVSSRLTGEIGSSSNPVSGMTIATLLFTCLIFRLVGWSGSGYFVTALSVGAIVCIASSNGGTTSQDLKTGFLLGGTPRAQQLAILIGAAASALVLGPVLLTLNRDATTYVRASDVAPTLRVAAESLSGAPRERLSGPQVKSDPGDYRVWHEPDPAGGAAKKFLMDEAGRAVWLVDPGINGQYSMVQDGHPVKKLDPNVAGGHEVKKLDAPKAILVSYIIKGILGGKLPWALVLFGGMVTLMLELCGIGSLAFAVGVYLPFAVSLPIFIGGLVRLLVDRRERPALVRAGWSEEEITAESDRSPGVLMASGYIAGGSIAGIVVAFISARMSTLDDTLTQWAMRANPFFEGSRSDALSLIPYAALILLLWLAARGRIFPASKGRAIR
ncbi:MAG: oligopeptide transporter, OPT family [Pedosphaera sp.]|nr:oligopeptide transporter, OPT family [Pedosphaera sp.]